MGEQVKVGESQAEGRVTAALLEAPPVRKPQEGRGSGAGSAGG